MNRLQVGDECKDTYQMLGLSDQEILEELSRVREKIKYIPETGDLIYIKKSGKRKPGDIMGYVHYQKRSNMRYRRVCFSYTKIGAHVLAWMLFHNEIPRKHIDHINGNTLDNRISNLRCVGYSGNSVNRRMRIDNKTGVTGVIIHSGKYRAEIRKHGKNYHLGYFSDLEDAISARKSAERELGFHVNHGIERLNSQNQSPPKSV